MRKVLLLLLIPIMLCGATFYAWRYREHSVDCTALTNGRARDLCFEVDDEHFYKCEPTVVGEACDTAGEWKQITQSPGGNNTWVQFNDSGVFGGDAGFTFNKATNTASVLVLSATSLNAAVLDVTGSSDLHGTNVDGLLLMNDHDSPTNSRYIGLGTGNDLKVYHDGTNSYITNDTGIFYIDSAGTVALKSSGLLMKEQAEADADVAAYGQVWVDTATPNTLWFTDDAGTDVQLGVGGTPEGTAVLSTGEEGATKYLREDGDGTCSWQTPAGAGDLLADGSVPLTADWNAGNSLYDITAVEFKGALIGNADTVTNATLTTAITVDTGTVTLTGNVANSSVLTLGAGASSVSGVNTGGNTGDNTVATSGDSATDFFDAGEIVDARISDTLTSSTCTGNAATVSTITGLAPDTATTQATQGSITSIANLATVGTIGTGVWEATDVGFAHGGTGLSAWTQYLIPYADTTTSIGQIAIGTAGQVLTSGGAGVAAAFETLAIAAGEYAAASIDGDDVNSNIAGRSLTLTGASPDTLDADVELYTDFKGLTIETPTDADNFFAFEAPIALTVTRVQGIVEAATSAVLTWQECDAAGDNCSTIESITADVDGTISTAIDNASIDAGDIIRLDVGTVTGTVGQAHSTITFTKND